MVLFIALLVVVGIIQAVAAACDKPSKSNVNVYLPSQHWTPPVREINPLGGNDLGGYVEHSRRTGATIQIVDKVEITNGNLTAERHMKISQPYISQPYIERSCGVFPNIPARPSALPRKQTAAAMWEYFRSRQD